MATQPPLDRSTIPLFGRCALEEGHLDEEQVASLLKEPLDTTGDDGSVTFANLCLKKKLLTPVLVQNILLVQNYRELRMEDEGMASIAVQRGLADEEVVRFALESQSKEFVAERKLPRRLCHVLIEAEVLTEQDAALLQAEWARARKVASAKAPPPRPVPAALPAYTPPPPPARTLGWLIVEFGDAIGRRIPIGEESVIGRFPSGSVPLHDPRISRHHVRIEIAPGTEIAFVTDLGSKNGTFLNQEKLLGRQPLKSGDLIRLGMSVLRYKSASEALSGQHPQAKEPAPAAAATPATPKPAASPAPPPADAATRTGSPATEPLPGSPGNDPPEFTEGRDITLPLIG
jgi:hypothetical protein